AIKSHISIWGIAEHTHTNISALPNAARIRCVKGVTWFTRIRCPRCQEQRSDPGYELSHGQTPLLKCDSICVHESMACCCGNEAYAQGILGLLRLFLGLSRFLCRRSRVGHRRSPA